MNIPSVFLTSPLYHMVKTPWTAISCRPLDMERLLLVMSLYYLLPHDTAHTLIHGSWYKVEQELKCSCTLPSFHPFFHLSLNMLLYFIILEIFSRTIGTPFTNMVYYLVLNSHLIWQWKYCWDIGCVLKVLLVVWQLIDSHLILCWHIINFYLDSLACP